MKAAQIDKLYGNLTPKEQANLAFEAIACNDIAELDLIVEGFERLNYRDTHREFRHRGWGLLDLGKYYGLMYWKTRACLLTTMINTKKDNKVDNQSLLFDLRQKLIAVDVALAEVCARLKHRCDVSKKSSPM